MPSVSGAYSLKKPYTSTETQNVKKKKILGEAFTGDYGRLERILNKELEASDSGLGFDISTDDFHLSVTVFTFIKPVKYPGVFKIE